MAVNAMSLSPVPKQSLTGKQKGAAALAAMLAIATPIVASWEGTKLNPYRDLVGVWTVCTGETRVEMRRYTPAECQVMLEKGLAEFGQGVVKRNPELVNRPNQWAAASSLSYNIGAAAYNRSTVAKRFSAGNFRGACDAFLSWSYAGGRQIKGLLNRRRDERALCLRGLS